MKILILIIPLFLAFNIALFPQNADTLKNDRFSIHAQTTVIAQYKPAFHAEYTGTNSLIPQQESKNSITSTLFLGLRLWKGASAFVNPELSGGSGLSQTLGIAAGSNDETFRIGDPAPHIYLARLFFRQIFSLTKEKIYQTTDFNQLGEYIPEKYLSLIFGKISISDFFDDNKYSHDPRTQFITWAMVDNGAWDYPANDRGYSPGIVMEFVTPRNEVRFGISLVPLEANGAEMNWNITEAGSYTLEYTCRYTLKKRDGAIRLLGFFTTANMGNYEQSIALSPINPVIEDTRSFGRTKYGFAISADQDINDFIGCFLRASWNDGHNETWVFTEIDHSLSAGFSMTGKKWKRENDQMGVGYVVSGISKPHREYLQAGGLGFILGDGNLNYALEHMMEFYYSFALLRNYIYLSGTYQLLINPGYNSDRHGPVNIFSVRLHARI